MKFEAICIKWTLQNKNFKENSEKCQIVKEFPFKIDETEMGTKQIVSGLKRTDKGKKWDMWVPLSI